MHGEPWGGQPYELALPERIGRAGIDDGYDVIAHLANLPYTMEYITVKLCRWFVNEDFSIGNYYNVSEISAEARLIRDCMVAWDTPAGDGRKGNIRSVLGAIFASDLFRGQAAMQQKVKTPGEYVHSALRALKIDLPGGGSSATTDGWDLSRPMEYMGMGFFARFAPDGYGEEGHEWIDTGTITERLRFIQNLMMHPDDPQKSIDYHSGGDDNICDPVALIQDRLDAGSWNDAGAVTDFLLGLVYPGEGTANLELDRAECIQLLNTDASGVAGSSPFLTLTDPAAYDLRVRSLAGLILFEDNDSPEFLDVNGATHLFPIDSDSDEKGFDSGTAHGFFRSLKYSAQILAGTDAVVAGTELSGFDTHNTQGGPAGGLEGDHAERMAYVGWAMYALRQYLSHPEVNLWDKTLVITLSEFGRTTEENTSHGTDHAEGGTMFVAGGPVRHGVYQCNGDDPVLPWATGETGAMFEVNARYLSRTVDDRSVLGEIIRDHLGTSQDELNRIIPGYANPGENLLHGGLSLDATRIVGELGLLA